MLVIAIYSLVDHLDGTAISPTIRFGSLSRMQARGVLLQQIYRWEQIGCLRRKPGRFKSGRRGDTDSSRGKLSEAAL